MRTLREDRNLASRRFRLTPDLDWKNLRSVQHQSP